MLIIEQYGIDELQLKEYNPSVERFGIRRRMNLRIPVYSNQEKAVETQSQETSINTLSFSQHEVAPKETKWRLAYQYKTTIEILDSLNPEIREGLKIGQKIRKISFDLRLIRLNEKFEDNFCQNNFDLITVKSQRFCQ